ncbi:MULTISPECIES: hypothetical protein [Cysteiniphilum]|uniref:hypothetical protein n=1 Tax=Cysteiniphilum TaxID=2056696 RepID=UPI00177F0606|nr:MULTISPECIES: hypothetical protein [Cysteiniphilum]
MKKLLISYHNLIIWILLLFSVSTHAGEFGVSPMYINFDSTPGKKHTFELTISGKTKGSIQLTPYHMTQAETGHMSFVTSPSDIQNSPSQWLSFEKNEYKYQDNETIKIPITINVPQNTSGSKFATVMVEELKDPKKANGIGVKVRYAVIVNFNIIDKRKPRVKLNVNNLTLRFSEGKLFATANVENLSDYQAVLAGKLYVRDENNKLIEKIPLNSKSSWERKYPGALIYPKGKILIFGLSRKIKKPGNYNISFRGKYGKRRIYLKDTALITKAMLPKSLENETKNTSQVLARSILQVHPNKYGKSFNVIKLKNIYSEPIQISFKSNQEYPWLIGYEFKPQIKMIHPGQSSVVILKQNFKPSKLKDISKNFAYTLEIKKNKQKINEKLNIEIKL